MLAMPAALGVVVSAPTAPHSAETAAALPPIAPAARPPWPEHSPPPSGREAPPAHQHQVVTLLALPQGRCATEWLLIL